MIIAIGFKVNNERAVQFRKWANSIVKDYTIKGWVMDEERLKNGGSVLTTEYFDRLLEQIREIRLSERRFYQKIMDIVQDTTNSRNILRKFSMTAGLIPQFARTSSTLNLRSTPLRKLPMKSRRTQTLPSILLIITRNVV